MTKVRQPAIFIPHGGGPCFWMESPPPFGPHAWDGLRDYLAGLVASLPERPKAFVVVTAHWEEAQPTVSAAAAPGMLYDYYGFPAHTYQLQVSGARRAGDRRRGQAPDRRRRTEGRRERRARLRPRRVRAVPDRRSRKREIPVVMLSLQRDLDPAFHIRARQGARAAARRGHRDRRQRHELPRPAPFPRRRRPRVADLRRLARRDADRRRRPSATAR